MPLNKKDLKKIKQFQRGEITEYYVYQNIAKKEKDKKNKEILLEIAKDELRHYHIWTEVSGVEIKPNKFTIFLYKILTFIFGYTFALRIMENGEEDAQKAYRELNGFEDIITQITKEEEEHEDKLLNMLDEERLGYVGSMVLGLNDALVELSGTLAGLTFAFQDTRLISLSGLITGVAASLSMAASEYLSSKADNKENAFKSSLYTGGAYIITVILLVLPYLLITDPFVALALMLATVVVIIFVFNFYISVAKNLNFKKRFFQMAAISLGVAALSFVIGIGIDAVLGVSI
ncbi:MAG TPA: VIT1/CCC1 transporter family protein [Candidatus Izemoplasmatales bacterium]|nr:VIT1/CCC1 transporter family protein [Candidatus Izemoplasmatales bacterium]